MLLIFIVSASPAEAIKKYWFDENGEKVFAPISQEEIHRRKSAPRRAYVRVPRTNWEMTPAMRARKKTTSQRTHRNYESKKKANF